MSQVKSTYNFVPAPTEDQVFKPDWADKVSHDIPFEDGESGEIEVVITAETPIFIREGISEASAKIKQEKGVPFNFSHYFDQEGKPHYFIPATSLKGMTRNVLEILSFSRLNKALVNDDRYSFRDLSSSKSEYMKSYNEFNITGGWLKEEEDGSWYIEECKEIAFINHVELQNKDLPFRNLFLEKAPIEKTAKYKYDLVDKNKLEAFFSTFNTTLQGNITRKNAKYDENGEKGRLVFTGQPSKRQEFNDPNIKNRGKFHEFVFFDNVKKNKLVINETFQKDFKFIYKNDDKNNISPDWKFWRDKLKTSGVPVFYSKNKEQAIMHFGLSYMYKLPFLKRIDEMLPISDYKYDNLDFATTIFGISEKEINLRGRVFFGNGKLENEPEFSEPQKEILGSPKASYFPFYLNQLKNNTEYNTYNALASLKGFKRYPVHKEGVKSGDYDYKQLKNKNVFSNFTPLKSGSRFNAKICFHNLKKVEIGALLSSLTFHGNEDKCSHNLGAAKSYGYGKVKVEIIKFNSFKYSKNQYLKEFEDVLTNEIPNWFESKPLTELFAMASNINDSTIKYPTINEFVSYKQNKTNNSLDPLFLESFSAIIRDDFKRNHFKSITNKSTPQTVLDLNFNRFSDLSNELNRLMRDEIEEFSEENKLLIITKIKYLFTNHSDSKKKLSKSYDWDNNILNWLGEEKMMELRLQLNIEL